jgi:hypothetical protein
MRSPSEITHRRPSQGPGVTERSWQAGDRIAFAGDGSELAELERQKRAAKPWLYEAESIGNMLPVGAEQDRLARIAPIGVPLAVKIGVCIGQARRRDQLRAVTAHAASALAGGLIGRDVADAIDEAISEKEKGLAWQRGWWQRVAPPLVLNRVEPAQRLPRIEHRTKLATSGPMPPDLAKHFTLAELAVMKIVADESSLHGTCRVSKKEIGDRARASETTVHNAIRRAIKLGMLSVKQRPVRGRKNLPNLAMITDPEWALWIARPKYRAIAEDRRHRQPTQGANPSTPQSVHNYKRATDGVWRASEAADVREELSPSENLGFKSGGFRGQQRRPRPGSREDRLERTTLARRKLWEFAYGSSERRKEAG